MKNATVIKTCHCRHPWQTKEYGLHRRVHNYGWKKEVWRCTVCKSEKR